MTDTFKENQSSFRSRFYLMTLSLTALLTLSACSSVGYRCPLDPGEQASSPTACVGMQDALKGAVNGTGGRTSVVLDDYGRIVPVEYSANNTNPAQGMKPSPAVAASASAPSGQPVYQNPQIYQVWTNSFEDGNGNFHDGHHSWFATPGKWNKGTVDPSNSVGNNIMRPTTPSDMPAGQIVVTDRNGNPRMQTAPITYQPITERSPESTAAIQNLSSNLEAATQSQRNAVIQTQSGVTSPSVRLGH